MQKKNRSGNLRYILKSAYGMSKGGRSQALFTSIQMNKEFLMLSGKAGAGTEVIHMIQP